MQRYRFRRSTLPSGIGLPEAEWSYSNVSTGAGVVAASSYAVYEVSLRDFLESTLRRQP